MSARVLVLASVKHNASVWLAVSWCCWWRFTTPCNGPGLALLPSGSVTAYTRASHCALLLSWARSRWCRLAASSLLGRELEGRCLSPAAAVHVGHCQCVESGAGSAGETRVLAAGYPPDGRGHTARRALHRGCRSNLVLCLGFGCSVLSPLVACQDHRIVGHHTGGIPCTRPSPALGRRAGELPLCQTHFCSSPAMHHWRPACLLCSETTQVCGFPEPTVLSVHAFCPQLPPSQSLRCISSLGGCVVGPRTSAPARSTRR